MYAPYWNLTRRPFENDADPAFFFRSRTHQAAMLKLSYLLESNKGAGLIVGGTGFGKTFLTRLLARQLEEPFGPVVSVCYPFLTATEFLAFLAARLSGDDQEARRDELATDRILRQLEDALHRLAQDGRHPILLIEDAHLIEDHRTFQAIQLLLNLRDHSPFTLILSGQRTLLARLSRMPELDERMGVKSLLQPLGPEETEHYVRHRLSVAGLDKQLFDPASLREIHELSGGVPRRINRIADLALLVGYADGVNQITAREIASVADEMGASANVGVGAL